MLTRKLLSVFAATAALFLAQPVNADELPPVSWVVQLCRNLQPSAEASPTASVSPVPSAPPVCDTNSALPAEVKVSCDHASRTGVELMKAVAVIEANEECGSATGVTAAAIVQRCVTPYSIVAKNLKTPASITTITVERTAIGLIPAVIKVAMPAPPTLGSGSACGASCPASSMTCGGTCCYSIPEAGIDEVCKSGSCCEKCGSTECCDAPVAGIYLQCADKGQSLCCAESAFLCETSSGHKYCCDRAVGAKSCWPENWENGEGCCDHENPDDCS